MEEEVLLRLNLTGVDRAVQQVDRFKQSYEAAARAAENKKQSSLTQSLGWLFETPGASAASATAPAAVADTTSAAISSIGKAAGFALPELQALTIVAEGVMGVFKFGYSTITRWLDGFWNLNAAIDDMGDQMAGLMYGITEWDKKADFGTKLGKSQESANILLKEYEQIALRVGGTVMEVQGGGQAMIRLSMGMGKTLLDAKNITGDISAAAKVMGVPIGQAAGSLERLVMTGRRPRDPFGMAMWADANIKKSDTMEQRFKKVAAAAKHIGEPIEKLAAGTEEAVTRLGVISDAFLGRLTGAIYGKMGEAIQGIVGWTEAHRQKIEDVIDALVVATVDIWDFGEGVWDALSAFDEIFGVVSSIGSVLDAALILPIHRLMMNLGMVGQTFKVLKQGWEELGHGAASQKLKDMKESLKHKAAEVGVWEMEHGYSVGGTPEQRLKMLKYLDPGKSDAELLQDSIDRIGKNMGEKPEGAAADREAKREADRKARDAENAARREALLKSMKGVKFEQNIEKIEIKQEFRDQDPDRVMVEFVKDLERIGENAIQSSIGGRGTSFGPG